MNAQFLSPSADQPVAASNTPPAGDGRRSALRRIVGAGALAATALALGGCGFALKGSYVLGFDTVYVNNNQPSSVSRALQRELVSAGAKVIADAPAGPQARAVVLGVILDQRERTVVGQTSSGQVRELELRYRFRFNLSTPTGRRLIEDQEILLLRSITFSETEVLSKSAEEQLMYTNMQNDVVQQVMRRLAAVKSF